MMDRTMLANARTMLLVTASVFCVGTAVGNGVNVSASARSLRERERQSGRAPTAVIALTANSYPEDRQRCLAAGMNDFITKPFAPEHLYATLFQWLAKSDQTP